MSAMVVWKPSAGTEVKAGDVVVGHEGLADDAADLAGDAGDEDALAVWHGDRSDHVVCARGRGLGRRGTVARRGGDGKGVGE